MNGSLAQPLSGVSESAVDQANIKESPYRFVILGISFLAQIAFSLVIAGFGPLGTFLVQDLHISFTQFGLIISASTLGTLVLLTFTGHWTDKLGVRLFLLVGQIVIGVFMIIASFTNDYWQLLIAMLCAGFGNSAAGPTTTKAVVTWFSHDSRATALSIKECAIDGAGILVGVTLPGIALAFGGWRAGFVAMGVFVLICGMISFALYRDSNAMKKMNKATAERHSWMDSRQAIFTRDIVLLSIGCGILMGVQFAGVSYMVLYLEDILKAAAIASPVVLAGMLFSFSQAGGVAGSVVWGQVSDRFLKGKRKGVLMGLNIAMLAVILALCCFGHGLPVVGIGILVFLYGLVAISWFGLYLTLITELSGFAAAGAATGFTLTLTFAGMMIVPPLFGAVLDATHGYFWAWIMIAVLAAIGIAFIAPVRERMHKA
jgi:MFS transporter, ACS family, hexuronate transporter